jgi:hypothetical protein
MKKQIAPEVEVAMAKAIVKNCQMIKLIFGAFCFLALIGVVVLDILSEVMK